MTKLSDARPAGVEFEPFASLVFDVMARYTVFPWSVLKTQCEMRGIDAARITPAQLSEIAPRLAASVARFTSPEQGRAVKQELDRLVRQET